MLSNKEELDLYECLRRIGRRRRLIIDIILLFGAFSIMVSLLRPKIYESRVIIQNGAFEYLTEKFEYLTEKKEIRRKSFLSWEEARAVITSSKFLIPVLERVGLDIPSEEIKEFVKKSIKIEPIRNTNLFEIKVKLNDKDKAYLLAEELAKYYIAYGEEIKESYKKIIPSLSIMKDFEIFEHPYKPKKSISPNIRQNILIGLFVGFIFGISLVFFLECLKP